MLLENMSWPEVDTYLKTKDIILVPIGSVEQHSPYGLIGTDFLCAEEIARMAAAKLEILVAPTLNYGISPHHMGFKGSVTLSPQTLILIICDLIRSFTHHGFKRIIFINGHGGNVDTIETAFIQAKSEHIKGLFNVISWYQSSEIEELSAKYFEENEGGHATPSEVSVTKFIRPNAFESKKTDVQTVENIDYYWPLSADEMRSFFPDGRMMSAPWLATEQYGKDILYTAAKVLGRKINKLMQIKII